MSNPTVEQLKRHLAFEVHWLVYTASRFREARNKDKVAFQDSAIMHARNLLEFTNPTKPRRGWWIVDVGGPQPLQQRKYEDWTDLINAKLTHMGEGRLRRPRWPVRHDDERLISLSRFVLRRIRRQLPAKTSDDSICTMRHISQLGLDYLDHPGDPALASLAGMT